MDKTSAVNRTYISKETIADNFSRKKIAYIESDRSKVDKFINKTRDEFEVIVFENGFKFFNWLKQGETVNAVVSTGRFNSINGVSLLQQLRADEQLGRIPFLFIVDQIDHQLKKELMKAKVNEVFDYNFSTEAFGLRLNYLFENFPSESYQVKPIQQQHYKMPLVKRVFDIVFASVALICLAPVFLVIGLIIRFGSKGPVFYSAKRAGTGYKIFDFYKFRSMRVGADAMLKDMAHLNQYKKSNVTAPIYEDGGTSVNVQSIVDKNKDVILKEADYAQIPHDAGANGGQVAAFCDECKAKGLTCQSVLMLDEKIVCEKLHIKQKKEKAAGETFVKIKDDPRVTKIGKFIRNTSIDELPQLFNVLKGDMSIVGNRPLPLYEAEKITVDQFTLRFMAPAGITGLWQVTKRGSKEMSEEERMQLDNDYATNYSFWRDIKIILKTIPALLQKENV